MPDLSHLWQRFVLAATLVLGLLVGIAATIFGYSNTDTVTVGFSVWRLSGVPLWTVGLVPLAVALLVGTLYHWWNNLNHFTEHMRHRRRVRELEAEVASLKEQLDHLLEMPDHGATPVVAATPTPEPEPEPEPHEAQPAELEPEPVPVLAHADLEPAASNGGNRNGKRRAGRSEPASAAPNGDDTTSTPETAEAANSEA